MRTITLAAGHSEAHVQSGGTRTSDSWQLGLHHDLVVLFVHVERRGMKAQPAREAKRLEIAKAPPAEERKIFEHALDPLDLLRRRFLLRWLFGLFHGNLSFVALFHVSLLSDSFPVVGDSQAQPLLSTAISAPSSHNRGGCDPKSQPPESVRGLENQLATIR